MRSYSLGSLVLGLACVAMAAACSDDTGSDTLPLNPGAGSGGTSSAGSAGTDAGGSAGDMGGSAGMGGDAAGSAGMGGGATAGSSGMAGSGMGGSDMGEPDAGVGEPDAGFGEPDAGGIEDEGDEDPQVEPLSFAVDIYPTMFGVGRCTNNGAGCHSDGGANGRGLYGSASVDTAYDAVSGNAAGVFGRVNGGGMPANCENDPNRDCFTPEELELLQAWIDQDMPE